MFKLFVLLVAVSAVRGLPRRGGFPLQKFGRPIPDGRIAGGHDADIIDYPYQLALFWFEYQVCGASMIGYTWALTAAHCTHGTYPEQLSVMAGSTDLTDGEVVQVAAIYSHPRFDLSTVDYDISVLKLAELITTHLASPIALHDARYLAAEGADITITGWGELTSNDTASHSLQAVVTKVISNNVCNEALEGKVTDRMMCAGNMVNGGEGSCVGDSGGPLIVNWKQYAIVSWGYGCGIPNSPGVNSRITEGSMRQFISEVTRTSK